MLDWIFKRKNADEVFDLEHRLSRCDISAIDSRTLYVGNFTWKFFNHPEIHKYRESISGKWVYYTHSELLPGYAKAILPLILDGFTPSIKYVRPIKYGLSEYSLSPLYIFSTEGCKKRLQNELKKYFLRDLTWEKS